MLLSDRDLRAEIEAGRLVLDPYDETLVQPSSVDVRLDRWFRVFQNHRYSHIDPALQQDDLTELVEPAGDEPFVLHPGEFVLGATLEQVTLPDDLAARLEGKALALGTPVPTPGGWRSMGDLAVGDEVFDERGVPCTVLAATEVLHGRPCFEVVFSDGQSVVADADHGWVTATRRERTERRSSTRTTVEIARTLRSGGEDNHHVAVAGPVQYETKRLRVDPYVLGVSLGDGPSAAARVTCADGDGLVLDELEPAGRGVGNGARLARRVGEGPGEGPRGGPGPRRPGAGARPGPGGHPTPDGSWSGGLRAGRLLADEHVPREYLEGDPAQRLELLQGLMDSRGRVDDRGRCEFSSTREVLADAVMELAASLGLRPVKRRTSAVLHGEGRGPAYRVEFTAHLPVFRLERRLRRLRTAEPPLSRGIRDVRPVPSVPVRCIQVSAASGMFLVGRTFIPTHNSSLGRLGLLTHSTAGFIDPGFSGHVTLELSNVANLPIKLWPGMRIGQICLLRLTSPASQPYGSAVFGSRYQGQRGPTPSRSWQSFTRADT